MDGFCPALLIGIDEIAEQNSPQSKLHLAGFTKALLCCGNSSVSPLNQQFGSNGSRRSMTVKYRRRPLISDASSTPSCDINQIPKYLEWQVPQLGYKQHAQFIADETVQQYCEDALAIRNIGAPATSVVQEVYDTILESANVVLGAMNYDLVGQMGTKFGYNVTTKHPSGKVINIDQDASKLYLDNGIINMMQDLSENEICGDPCYVGSGLFTAWDAAQKIACCNAAGIDASKIGTPNYFTDKATKDLWGLNSVGLLAPGSVKLITRMQFSGPAFSGYKGGSYFMTFTLPVAEFNGCDNTACLQDLQFDLQMKYIDCPGTNIDLNGVETTVDRGWLIIVSKQYALWVQPLDAYNTGDPLANTNGTLKYYITNEIGAGKDPYALYY